ncbi:MAG: hypothetical protein IJA89_04710 [Clostridia bacterium]|nr:hypothetical protein [Clostridia bacterium]
MKKKNEKREELEELDTETTFADMNVEGFSWYNPHKKKNQGQPIGKVSKKEYWAMVRGAFAAMLPMLGCIVVGGLLIFLIAFLWLK